MVCLLYVCVRLFSECGMVGIYVDGLKFNDYCFEILGKIFW